MVFPMDGRICSVSWNQYFSQENIISIHSKSTLFEWNQLQEMPLIPLSVEVVEIVIKIEIDDASVEGFFSNLLRQQM